MPKGRIKVYVWLDTGSRHPIYNTWHKMVGRCTRKNNQDYAYYGARGIKVCQRWMNFESFSKDMLPTWRPGLTLERIDNNGNYEPSNCQWATRKVQANNSRRVHFIEFNGRTQSVSDWSIELKISRLTLTSRILKGWPLERALTTPARKLTRRHVSPDHKLQGM